jgi:hypothetical protein
VIGLWYLGVVTGLALAVRRHRPLLVLVAWAVGYGVGYTALGVPGYAWYALPIQLVLSLLFGLGLAGCAELVSERFPRRRVGLAVALLLIGLVVFRLALPTVGEVIDFESTERHRAYFRLAGWLDEHVEKTATIAYHEIGYLGYYTDNRIIDLVGLVTPEITPHVAGGDFAWGFWHFRPDVLVELEGSRFFDGIVRHPRFAERYRPVVELPGFSDRRLTVYRRIVSRPQR